MQRLSKYGDNQNTNLTPYKPLKMLIHWTLSYVIICESHTLSKWSGFL